MVSMCSRIAGASETSARASAGCRLIAVNGSPSPSMELSECGRLTTDSQAADCTHSQEAAHATSMNLGLASHSCSDAQCGQKGE